MVEEVLADVWRGGDGLDVVGGEDFLRSNSGEHQQLRRLENSLREDDLLLRTEGVVFPVRADDSDAGDDVVLDHELLGVCRVHESHVGLALDEDLAGGTDALVNGVHALDESVHFTRVDFIGELLTSVHPGPRQCLPERFELGHHVGDGDVKRAIAANLCKGRAI
jgi:hypothetical protein